MKLNQEAVDKIIALAKMYGATRLILFGSAADRPHEARDIDLACDGIAGWKLYELAAKLEEELHTPLDIVPLSPATHFTKFIETRGRTLI